MSKIKRLAGETVLYGLGSIVPRAINFLLVVLHTKNMFSAAEYGKITIIRDNKVTRTERDVNMLLVLGFDVYRQAPDVTISVVRLSGTCASKTKR